MSALKKSVIIVFAVLILDQALKVWVKTHMMLGDEFKIFDWFIIHFVENNGMAFGMELAGKFGKIILSVFRIVAVIGIGYYLYGLTKKGVHTGLIACISLVLAGALGNIIDSAFYGLIFNESYSQVAEFVASGDGYAPFLYGKVVDMLYFPLIEGYYPSWIPFKGGDSFIFFRPVFNIADSAITIGIVFILVFQKRFFQHEMV